MTFGSALAAALFIFETDFPYHSPAYPQISHCDPAYPDFCIASPPPDLNCPEIADNEFTVLPPDPHGFDRDIDDVGCES